MMPRWKSALLLITLPLWFLPLCAWVGFLEGGLHTLREVPAAIRWAFLGQRP